MAFGTPASRKLLVTMVLLVAAVDGVAIGSYYAFELDRRPQQIQLVFTAIWILLTLAVCAVYLKRIRELRNAAMRRARPKEAPGGR
jgi:hypothetical protein